MMAGLCIGAGLPGRGPRDRPGYKPIGGRWRRGVYRVGAIRLGDRRVTDWLMGTGARG